jgi:hypothetical protein
MAWWDACIDPMLRPALTDRSFPAWAAVDASTKRDSTAILVCAYDRAAKKVRLVCHHVFQPTPQQPLDFEETVESTLLDLRQRFRLIEVRYDPYQMQSVAQRLIKRGLKMVEFPQTLPNITESSTNLYDLIKARNLIVYPDEDLRLAVQRAVAIEMPRGWKISKATASHKIDVVVALGMAALAAVQGGVTRQPLIVTEKALQVVSRGSAGALPVSFRKHDWPFG